MNVSRTSGTIDKVRICVVLVVAALASLALAVGPAAAGPPAADLQAAHAAHLTQGTTLGAGTSGIPALGPASAMMRAASVAARIDGTTMDVGNNGGVVAAVPVPVPNPAPAALQIGKAARVSEPATGGGIAALVAAAALVAVGLMVGFAARSRSSAERAGETAAPTTLRPAASASAAPDDRLRHAA